MMHKLPMVAPLRAGATLLCALMASPAFAGNIIYEYTDGHLTGLTYDDGTKVTYTYDARGNRTATQVQGGPDRQGPSVPAGLTVQSTTATQVNLSWTASTDNVGISNYSVYRCTGTSCTPVAPAIGTAATTTYSDGSRAPSTSYRYSIAATDGAGNTSALSLPVLATTTADTTAPTASALAVSSTTATDVNLSWTAATDNVGVVGYTVYRCTGTTCTPTSSVGTTAASKRTFKDTGRSPNTSYRYSVAARDAASNSKKSNVVTAKTKADTTVPNAPTGLTVTQAGPSQLNVSWVAPSDNIAVTGYQLDRCAGETCTTFAQIALPTTTSYADTGLTASSIYRYQVRARDAAGNWSAYSAINSGTTGADTQAPGKPGTPAFSSITGTTATATWTAATDNIAVASYEYRLNSASTWSSAGNVLTVNLTGLTYGTNYLFEVRAKDGAGNSGAASSASFTTTADTTPPTQPGVPTFGSITGTSATASWNAATDNVGVTSYEYRLNGSSWMSTGSARTANLSGLVNGTTYTFDVRAKDAADNAGSASSGSFSTPDTASPTAPTGLSFSTSGSSATISWVPSADNVGVTGYDYQLDGGTVQFTAATSIGFSGLALGAHSIGVRARDAAGNTSGFTTGSFSIVDSAAPTTPTGLTASVSSYSVGISWNASTDNFALAGYDYQLDGGSLQSVGTATRTASYSNLSVGSHSFSVRARDTSNNTSSFASTGFTIVDVSPPSGLGSPSASPSYTSATVSWTAASDNVSVVGYDYQFNGGAWVSNGTSTSVSLSGLSVGTSYSITVRARDAAGNSTTTSGSFTTLLPAITLPSTPINNSQSGSGGSTAKLSLSSAGNIEKYNNNVSTPVDIGDWLSPQTGMSQFEVIATPNTGTCQGSPLNTPLNLGSTVIWSISVSGIRGATASCAVNLAIRRVGASTVLATGTFVLVAVGT